MEITLQALMLIMEDEQIVLKDGTETVFEGHITDVPRMYIKKEIMSLWYNEINKRMMITLYK